MGWDPLKEVKKRVKQFRNEANGAMNRVRNVGREVERDLERKVPDLVSDQLPGLLDQELPRLGSALESRMAVLVTEKVPELITEELPEAMQTELQRLATLAAEDSLRKVLDEAADTIELMSPSWFGFTFGGEFAFVAQIEFTVAVTIPNPVSKLTEIKTWKAKPPKGRAQIIDCIQDFGPSGFEVEFKVSGNGFKAGWDGDDKYDRLDQFLAKRGVS